MDLCTLWRKVVETQGDDPTIIEFLDIEFLEEVDWQNLAQHLENCEQCLNLIYGTPTPSPEELLATKEIMKAQEEDTRKTREAVASLITVYPSLAPDKYGLPDAADPTSDLILYYIAWSGVKCLTKRLAYHCVNETVERFTIGEDGSLLIQGTLKSDLEAQEVVNNMHLTTDTGVIRLDPQYVQSEICFMSDGEIGPEDAQRMALWLRDAIRLHPKLSAVNGEELDKWKVDNENKPQ